MTNSEMDGGTTHDDLVQRVALIETMIAEGRRFTMRCGWIFVLWGLVTLAGVAWQSAQTRFAWVWPVCFASGFALMFIGLALRKKQRGLSHSMQCRNIEAVWGMMGIAMGLYVATALFQHLAWQQSYMAALLVLIGMAHAISASILRWSAQGWVAGVWWAGAIAMFFCRTQQSMRVIFVAEMCVGMVLFGLYAMLLERRNGGGWVGRNA